MRYRGYVVHYTGDYYIIMYHGDVIDSDIATWDAVTKEIDSYLDGGS